MPIEVLHGGEAGPVAGQIIAQSGLANLQRQQQDQHLSQQLQQQRDMQMQQIDAQADLSRQSADQAMAQTALQHGLQGQLQEQLFDQTVKKMRIEALQKAQEFNYEFTAKDRQEIAKFNNADQMIDDSPDLSQEEKVESHRRVAFGRAGITLKAMPSKGFKWPVIDGQQTGLGIVWQDKASGALVTGEMDANGSPSLKLIQRHDQGPEAQKAKAQEEVRKSQIEHQLEHQQKMEFELMKFRIKLMSDDDVPDKWDSSGKVTSFRRRNATEVEAIIQSIPGGGQQAASGGQQQAPRIGGDDDYSKLEPGTVFIGTDGKLYQKPKQGN